MPFLWRDWKNPFKKVLNYSKVVDRASRSSSDESRDSNDGLIEKEIEELRQRSLVWRRYTSLIVLNLIVFIIYGVSLYAITSHVSKEFQQGPNLVFCEFMSHFRSSMKLIKQHPHMRLLNGRNIRLKRTLRIMALFLAIPVQTLTRIGTNY